MPDASGESLCYADSMRTRAYHPSKCMRILLAESRPRVRFALRALLEEQPGLQIVGEAAHGQDLLAQIEAACPDLVLLSWGLPGQTGTDLLTVLRSVCDDLYVIVLSGRPEARQAILDAGASAFISKVEPPERLLAAIESVEHTNRKGGKKQWMPEVESCIDPEITRSLNKKGERK
jgi:DNA-binding NarL/FixJ family response regulator